MNSARESNSGFVSATAISAFRPGALVVVSLHTPREKFWGALLLLAEHGAMLAGISLESFDDFASQIRSGEAVRPNVVFFPMHRVERIEVDQHSGDVPSMAERFRDKTGIEPEKVLVAEASA